MMYLLAIALGGGPGQRCSAQRDQARFFLRQSLPPAQLGEVKPRRAPPIIISMFVSAAVLVAVLVLAAGLDVRT